MKKINALKVVSLMVIISIIGKILGLFRDIQFAYYFGTDTIESHAFTTASVLPRVFLDITFASVISAGFIPIFNEYIEKKDKREAFLLTSNFLNILFLLSSIIVIFFTFFSFEITYFIQSGLPYETRVLSQKLLINMLPIIIFSCITFTLTGVLHSFNNFLVPASINFFSNLIILGYFFIYVDDFGIVGLSFAYTLGWLFQIIIQLPSIKKLNYKHKFIFNIKDEGLKKIFLLILPIMISTWAMPINYLINLNVTSLIDGGTSATALNISYTFYTIVSGVFILSIGNLIFPNLAKLTANNNTKQFVDYIKNSISTILFLTVPLGIGMFVMSYGIIRLLYENGRFDSHSTYLASKSLQFYSLGIVGYGIYIIITRAFYSLKDAKTPLKGSILCIGINLFFTSILFSIKEIWVSPLANSISITISSLYILIILNKKFKNIIDTNLILNFIKILISSFIMGIVVLIIFNNINLALEDNFINKTITVVVPIFIGVIVYFFLTFLLKANEILLLIEIFKSKRSKNVL